MSMTLSMLPWSESDRLIPSLWCFSPTAGSHCTVLITLGMRLQSLSQFVAQLNFSCGCS
jgi:hypothetical protein